MSFIVTNKWLKSAYGGPLRKLLSEESWVESVVDFGHAKQIFPDADVFPCILTTCKPHGGVAPAMSRVCAIPRDLLRIEDLSRQIEEAGVDVPRNRLGAAPWSLEPPAVDELLEKMRRVGVPLKEFMGSRPLFGIKTGLNDAFLMDQATRDALVAQDAKSAELLRKYIRGQDVRRWRAEDPGLWMLAIKSSGDHPWPWADSGDDAEKVFAATYPAVHAHLSSRRDALQKRQDKGKYWWELRSCAYWGKFDQPKMFYQDITWQPQVCFDSSGMLANNTVYFLPSSDLWVAAVLNSPIGWWFAWRKAQHGKDEALRFFTDFVEAFPIPKPSDAQRATAERCIRRLLALAGERHRGTREMLDWLRVEFEIAKPTERLSSLVDLDGEELVAEVRKVRGKRKPLSPTSLRALRDGHAQNVEPLRIALGEAAALERELSGCVNEAFGITAQEQTLLWKTAPPRTPCRPNAAQA